MFFSIIKDYFLRSSLHGLKFILDGRYMLVERIFWMICVILAWIAVGCLVVESYSAFLTNPIETVVDTDFIRWNTSFPSIIVCETFSPSQGKQKTIKYLQTKNIINNFDMEDNLNVIAFFTETEFTNVIAECKKNPTSSMCFPGNYSYYMEIIRSSCDELINNCMWNGVPFDCCDNFMPIMTVYGKCYALNSLQTTQRSKLDMTCNSVTGPGKLLFNTTEPIYVHIVGREEVPIFSEVVSIKVTMKDIIQQMIAVAETGNDDSVREVDIETRECRFIDENYLKSYPSYSYSACVVDCIKKSQIEKCNCTTHSMPLNPGDPECGYLGVACLKDNNLLKPANKKAWSSDENGMVCHCDTSCTEMFIDLVAMIKTAGRGPPQVEILLTQLPSEKYIRTVVRGKLDLVVSIGGTVGLFVGASLLSLVEIFYFLFIRPVGTRYLQQKKLK